MNFRKNIFGIAIILACAIIAACEDQGRQGLMVDPRMLVPDNTPVANAGVDQNAGIMKGSVDLDGSASFDPAGKSLAYAWTVTYQPAGSVVSFSKPAGVKTSFAFDTTGTYEIMLTVNNGSRSASDTVTVDVAVNSGPTANAGSTQEVTVGDTVTLDGSGSTDPEGDPLVYTWTQIYGPTIGAGTLTGVNPNFTAPTEVCTIVYDLRVDDGSGNSSASRVFIFVMNRAGAGIYVAPGGDDANEGSREMPKKTIHAGIGDAFSSGSDVYIAAGVYNESVTLANGVGIFGGFDPSSWVRDSFGPSATHNYTTTIQGGAIAIDGNGIGDATIDGLTITSAGATIAGNGSYGIRLIYSTITIRYCDITAGSGASADNGSNGSNGQGGGAGNNGEKGGYGYRGSSSMGYGGAGGDSDIGRSGGTGGFGGYGEGGETGENGQVAGSGGGAGGANSSNGSDGSSGSGGADGSGGSSGSIKSNLWVSSLGTTGIAGTAGNGGGGGGGGGGSQSGVNWSTGNGGGGGGAGGGGGMGGAGGYGGGGSFGIFIIESDVTVEQCSITSGNGGNGGTGGAGGSGGTGGAGGAGGTDIYLSPAGIGGHGGAGGQGGNGGGGAGGPSFSIFKYGFNSRVVANSAVLTYGSGGAGGSSGGNAGSNGESGQYGGLSSN